MAQDKKLNNYGMAALFANVNAKAWEQEGDANKLSGPIQELLKKAVKNGWHMKRVKKTSSTKKQLRIITDKALAYSLAFIQR